MLAAQQQTGAPLTQVGAIGTVIGWTSGGAPIVPGAVEDVAWTECLAGFAARPELQGTAGSLWITAVHVARGPAPVRHARLDCLSTCTAAVAALVRQRRSSAMA